MNKKAAENIKCPWKLMDRGPGMNRHCETIACMAWRVQKSRTGRIDPDQGSCLRIDALEATVEGGKW